jgi:EPS-associated MarR family transcriptional regulator
MASQRKEQKEYAKLRVMQILDLNPQITTREIAKQVGISNGSAYYLLVSLIDMGSIKFSNFKENTNKLKYSYLLTPKGIREKSILTSKFLEHKKKEYEALRAEIKYLEVISGNRISDDEFS